MSSFITTSIEYMDVKEYLAVDSSHFIGHANNIIVNFIL